MKRGLFGRSLAVVGTACVAGLALATSSCGGGSAATNAAKPLVMSQFLFVDRALEPSFPPELKSLPRNAQILMRFSDRVNPESINDQTIQIRYGPNFASVPKGSFQVDGNSVLFDPTRTKSGTPNPFGFEPVTQYQVDLPKVGEQDQVVENLDHDPNLIAYLTNFTTSEGYLRELDPPSVTRVYFIPPQDPVTGYVPGNSLCAMEFTEAMDPATFTLSVTTGTPEVNSTVDVRYLDFVPKPNVNSSDGLSGVPVPGTIAEHDGAAKTYYFRPTFSFGSNNKRYVFTVQTMQGIRDLSGNTLINPKSFGPYTTDGQGTQTGRLLAEPFNNMNDSEPGFTDADWGQTEQGRLLGAAITSKVEFISGYTFALQYNGGQYNPVVDPLVGAQLNTFVPNVQPPTSQGRRVMWSFSDTEVKDVGSVTLVSWGPDSNAIFAAHYPDCILRIGYQKSASLSLSPSFSGNYEGTPLTMYSGPYDVAQKADVGNQIVPTPVNTCTCPNAAQLNPLFDWTGFYAWPVPTSFFEFDVGDPNVDQDRVLLFDASVSEGDTWQQLRNWYAVTFPNSGVLIGGFPNRRLFATFEEDVPNPPSNFALGIVNPEPSITDMSFTITKRISMAQTRFYTPDSNGPGGPYPTSPTSVQKTFGTKSNYQNAQFIPAVQTGGTAVVIEYQAALALEAGSRTNINSTQPFTPWTTNVKDCRGFPYIRWRLTLISNLNSNKVAKLDAVTVPIIQDP